MIGAVNCVINEDGTLVGDNTDGKGFLQSVMALRPVRGLNAVVLGAGGAARAIAVELALAGTASLTIVNRSAERGRALANSIQVRTGIPTTFVPWEGKYQPSPATDLLINATSIGLYPDTSARVPVALEALRKSASTLVCDVIPNPPRTTFLRDAESRGFATLDGLGMLVNQGVIGIRLWSGKEANPSTMRKALEDVFTA